MRVQPWAGSVLVHVLGIALLLLLRSEPVLTPPPQIVPIQVRLPEKMATPAMGGGGQESRRASRGRLPLVARLAFTPPTTKPPAIEPALPMAPTILGEPPAEMAALQIGDPFGLPGPPSDGQGKRGGIGNGEGGGVGNHKGPRAGTAGTYSIAAVSTAPVLIHKVDPEFSEEARKARLNGVVVLRIIIDEKGVPTAIEVVRTPGMGLSERAVGAVSQWRFRPGRQGSKAVSVWATVEVNFSLL